MNPIVTFTLVSPDGSPDAPSTEAQLFEISARATKAGGIVVPGLTPVHTKELSVRVRSALAQIPSMEISPVHAVVEIGFPVKAGKPGLTGYNITPTSGTAALDLPTALAVLDKNTGGIAVAGELGLDGAVRAIRGVLAFALAAHAAGLRGVMVPAANVGEALEAPAEALDGSPFVVLGVAHMNEVDAMLAVPGLRTTREYRHATATAPDFADIRGHEGAVAALIAAVRAGKDAVLVGPSGVGKTMLARRVGSILAPMPREARIALTKNYSALGIVDHLLTERPFRAPHYTISAAALLGGGNARRPGEIHLAAYGVLLLDEVAEFSVAALAGLRIALDRMGAARPMVIVTGSPEISPGSAARFYRALVTLGISVSKPLADPTSEPIAVDPVSLADLKNLPGGESSASIRARIWA